MEIKQKTFFNFSTLEKIYKNREIYMKISIKHIYTPYNLVNEYVYTTQIDNYFPNNIENLLILYPNIKNDIENYYMENQQYDSYEIKMVLSENNNKMSILSVLQLKINKNNNIMVIY